MNRYRPSFYLSVRAGERPAILAGIAHPHVLNQEMIVEAGLTGDGDLAFQAFLNDPLVSHHPEARKMFEEMFEAHSQYLPQFRESSGLWASYR
jgi:galacturan 1,4-alpha-galacturonidase